MAHTVNLYREVYSYVMDVDYNDVPNSYTHEALMEKLSRLRRMQHEPHLENATVFDLIHELHERLIP